MLVVEDLHWADESTVLLTEYLAPLLPEMPVLVLGTYRDAEADLSQPLGRVIGNLGHRGMLERISLRRLSVDGVSGLRALAGQPAPRVDAVIHRETEGNPFFVEEVYLHLVESGCCLTSMADCEVTFGWMKCRYQKASAWLWGSGWTAWPRPPMRCW